jgi:hypothetical protein
MTNKEVSTLSKFDEWQFQWLPYKNPLNDKAGWDGTYFDHYGSFGEEFKRVASQDPRQVWSLVNVGCQGWNIMSGIQPGAYGYFITKKKRPKGNHLVTVVIEPDHDCDDPSLLGLH